MRAAGAGDGGEQKQQPGGRRTAVVRAQNEPSRIFHNHGECLPMLSLIRHYTKPKQAPTLNTVSRCEIGMLTQRP